VGHAGEMKFSIPLKAFAKKTVENSSGGRSVEASVMKTQSDFYRIRHSALWSPSSNQSNLKALKDGWDWRDCQE
jgi:hypothetical protein